MIKTFSALVLFLLITTSVSAKNLYVDGSSGNDTVSYNSNSSSQPWRTIGRATWGSTNKDAPISAEAAKAGDTVIVRAGTYTTQGSGIRGRFDVSLNPVNSGSEGSPITFQTEGVVVIRPEVFETGNVVSATSQTIQLASNASTENDFYSGWYIRIASGVGQGQSRLIWQTYPSMDYRTSYSGTTKVANIHTGWSVVPNSTSVYELTKPGPLIGAANKSYIVWKGFKIIEGDSYAPDTGPVVVVSSNNITLTDIEIVGTVLPVHMDNHNGIRIENSNNVTVKNTSIHGYKTNPGSISNTNNSSAVMVYTSDNLIFENNNIYDTSIGFFLKGGNGGHIVRYNKISDCDKAFRTSYHTNVSFYQNIIENCNVGYNPAENIDTIRFYNNVIVNATWGIYNWFPTNGFESYNNVFYNVTNPHFWEDVTGTFTTDHNDYFTYNSFIRANRSVGGLSEWQALGFDSGSISINPGFVNFSSGDYHLQSNSPLLNAGRSSGPIGVYITGDEVIGINTGGVSPSPSPTPTPPPPTPTPPPPTPTPTPLAGDLNTDHVINALDWSIMNSQWFTGNSQSDLRVDGQVNSLDFAILSSNWGRTW